MHTSERQSSTSVILIFCINFSSIQAVTRRFTFFQEAIPKTPISARRHEMMDVQENTELREDAELLALEGAEKRGDDAEAAAEDRA